MSEYTYEDFWGHKIYSQFPEILPKVASKYFDIWWDENRYNWNNIEGLAKNLKDKFDVWFKPEKINWGTNSCYLAQMLPDKFDDWFDKEKFCYKNGIIDLIIYNHRNFNKWWDASKIDMSSTNVVCVLSKHCFDYFDMWGSHIDKEKVYKNKTVIADLITYCNEYIKLWWDKELIDYQILNDKKYLNLLMDKIDIWFDFDKVIKSFDNELILKIYNNKHLLDKKNQVKFELYISGRRQ